MTAQDSSGDGTGATIGTSGDAFDPGIMLAEAQIDTSSDVEAEARNQVAAGAEKSTVTAEELGAADGVFSLSGNRSDYQIIYDAGSNSFTVIDNRPDAPDGTRTIRDIRSFKFADSEVPADELANSAPRFATPFLFLQVPEHTPGVIPLTATGPDGRPISYNIVGGDDRNLFRTLPGGASNVIAFAYAPDYESDSDANRDGIYEVVVSAVDESGVGTTQELQIQVTNIENDPSPTETPAAETQQTAQPVPQGGSSTPPPVLEPEIVLASFETEAPLGVGAIIPQEPQAPEPLVSAPEPVPIDLAGGGGGGEPPPPPPPPNTPPVSTDGAAALIEDGGHQFALTDFAFSDADANDSLSAVRIVSLPDSGRLLLNGQVIAAGAIVPVSAIAAGSLTFVPFNLTTSYSASFGFAVLDQSGDASAVQSFVLNVGADNDAPSTASTALALSEDAALTLTLADFPFVDPDADGTLSAVVITSVPGEADGELRLNGQKVVADTTIDVALIAAGGLAFVPVNAAEPYVVTIGFAVKDQGGLVSEARELALSVAADNDAPSSAAGDAATGEDAAYTFTPADFPFSDPDRGDAATAVVISSVPGDGDGRLLLDGVSVVPGTVIPLSTIAGGGLTFVPGNRSASYTVTFGFAVQDKAGVASAGQEMVISVSADNDAPDSGPSSAITDEETAYTFTTADFPFSDADSDDTLADVVITSVPAAIDGRLLLNGSEIGAGAIVSAGAIAAGALVFVPANQLSLYEVGIGFQVRDPAGLASGEQVLRLTIGADNDGPVSSDVAISAGEDDDYVFSLADFPFTGPDAGDTLASVVITTVPGDGEGRLQLNGKPVAAGDIVPASAIAAGQLVFEPADALSGYDVRISFAVQDAGGLTSAIQHLTVSVAADDDAPISGDASVSASEDAAYVLTTADFPFQGPDAGDALAEVVIDRLPDAGSGQLLLDGVPVEAGTAVAAAMLAAGALVFVPSNQSASYAATLGFSVVDQGGQSSASQTLTIGISADNDGPGSAGSSAKTDEDTTYVLSASDFPFSDPDQGDSLSSIVITSVPGRGQGRLLLDGEKVAAGTVVTAGQLAAGALTFVPSNRLDFYEASIGFTVQDQAGASSGEQVLRLTVGADNDGPSSSDTSAATTEDAPYTFALADFPFSGPDDDDSLAAVLITSVPDEKSGRLLLDGKPVAAGATVSADAIAAGALVFVPSNQAQDYGLTIGFAVVDQGGLKSAIQHVTLTVDADNDGPGSAGSTARTDEDTAYVLSVSDFPFSDPDQGDSLSSVVITSVPDRSQGRLLLDGEKVAAGAVVTAGQLAAGALTFVPSNRLDFYEASIGFTVQDQAGASSGEQVLRLTVGADNDGPSSSDTSAATTEDAPYTFALADFPFSGPDDDDSLAEVLITSVPDEKSGRLLLNGKAIEAGATVAADAIAAGALVFAPSNQVQDYGLTIGFAVVDQGGLKSAIQHVTLTVDADNDGPGSAGSSARTDEDVPYVFTTGDFPFSDADLGDGLSGIIVTSLPGADQGKLTLNGVLVSAGTIVSANAIAAGELAFVPLDKTGPYSTGILFSVMDAAGARSAEHRIDLVVTGDNDAPVITFNGGGADDPIFVRSGASLVATLTGTDQDTARGDLTWSLNGPGVLDKSYSNDLFSIDPLTGDLTFLEPPDNSGSGNMESRGLYKVKVFLNDGETGVDQDVFVRVVPDDLTDAPADAGTLSPGLQALVDAMVREGVEQSLFGDTRIARSDTSAMALLANDNAAPVCVLVDGMLVDLSDTAEAYLLAGMPGGDESELFDLDDDDLAAAISGDGAGSIEGDHVLYIVDHDLSGMGSLDADTLLRGLRDDFII